MVSINIDPWVAAAGLVAGALLNLATLVAYDRYVKGNMNKAFDKMEAKIAALRNELTEFEKR